MSSKNRWHKTKTVAAVFFSFLLCLGMAGCKPTDFFTEVLVSSSAEQVDENATNRTIINSPDADIKDETLAALRWNDDSLQSENVESLVVWSSTPNSILSTHRSIYDLEPRFTTIESSEGVRLVFDEESNFDHSVESGGTTSRNDLTSVSPAINAASNNDGAATQSNASASEGAVADTGKVTEESGSAESDQSGASGGDGGTDPSNPGSGQGGDATGSGEGTATSDDPGTEQGDTANKFAGLGGDLQIFDPTNSSTRIPHVQSIVAIGKQAAVMTEVIGGSGSICALSNASYNNADSYAVATFNQIFGDLGNGECSSSVVAWAADTAESIQSIGIESFEAILKTWPQGTGEVKGTLVVYDQSITDDPTSLFTEEQLDYLAGYGVQGFWPVDFSTQAGIYNAANFVGQALSESTVLADGWDSTKIATKYRSTLQELVSASEAVHGGSFVRNSNYRTDNDDISYVGNLGSDSPDSSLYLTQAIIATDAATGLSYSGQGVDASGIVLFGGNQLDYYSPLSVWMRAAGVEDMAVQQNKRSSYTTLRAKDRLTLFWGTGILTIDGSTLSGSGAAYNKWKASSYALNNMWNWESGTDMANGLGSSKTPYLIVCGSSDGSLTSSSVKTRVVESINSGTSAATPYTAFSYKTAGEGASIAPYTSYDPTLVSTIGATGSTSTRQENPFLDDSGSRVNASDCVRLNPNGLLGSWVEGNAESALETLWLTSLYTEGPSNSNYDGSSYDWGKFSITVGDTKISGYNNSSRKQAVCDTVAAFYQTFYRYDISSGTYSYSDVVPDEGL